jgi:signal transduction histidine kinase
MKKMRLLILLLFCANASYAQVLNRDSLLSQLSFAKEDTNKVYLLYSISDQYETSEPEKAKYYVGLAGRLSRQLNFEKGIYKFYRYSAFINAYQARYDSVLYFNKIVLDLATEKKDTFNIGVSLFNIGEAYKFMSDYENGLQYTLEGVKMLQGHGYTNIEANLYGGLQGTYLMLKQYDKAIEFGLKAVALGRKLSDKNSLVSSLTNLANCYGEVTRFSEAKGHYKEAIETSVMIGNKSVEAMCYEGLADVALKEGDIDRIKVYAEKALTLHSETQNGFGVMAAKQALGVYYLHTKDFTASRQLALEALEIANEENFIEGRADVLATLSEISFAQHDFSNAFRYADESKKTNEKIFTELVAQKDAHMRVKYETEKKDTQLKLQAVTIRQKNILNYILIGSAVALLIISVLMYRNYSAKQRLQKQRIRELEKEKQLNATEAVLKGEEQERTRLAKDLHDGLGGMLSGIKYGLQTMRGNLIMTPDNARAFERSLDMLDSSIREMRRVAHNMMPEALVKFGLDTALRDYCQDINQSGAINVEYQSIGLDHAMIEQTTAIALYRIVQELVSNILKHAAATTAIVQITKTNNLLSITVEDDGKGFDINILKQSRGIGWSNIQNRVEFLKGKLDVSTQSGKGTSVLIEVGVGD